MKLRPDFTKKDQFIYPAYQRSRLPLRSPMKSENINLEDHLFSFDIHNLYNKVAALELTLKDSYSYMQREEIFQDILLYDGDGLDLSDYETLPFPE